MQMLRFIKTETGGIARPAGRPLLLYVITDLGTDRAGPTSRYRATIEDPRFEPANLARIRKDFGFFATAQGAKIKLSEEYSLINSK